MAGPKVLIREPKAVALWAVARWSAFRAALRIALGLDVHPIPADIDQLSGRGELCQRALDLPHGGRGAKTEEDPGCCHSIADEPDPSMAEPRTQADDEQADRGDREPAP